MGQVLYNGADAAYPDTPPPPGTRIVCGYIGLPGQGSPDTPHIWTPSDWNAFFEADQQIRFLPVYVHNYPDSDPAADAANAVEAARRLGWTAGLDGSSRRIIALDLETLVAPGWVAQVIKGIEDAGFRCMPYGSTAYVTRNPAGAGYWEADYTGVRPTVLGPGQLGRQWNSGEHWDLDVFTQEAYDGCGIGRRWG